MHHYGSTLHLHSLKIFITDREGFNGIQSKSKIHMKQGYFFASCADSCNSPEQTHVVSIRQLAINQYSGVEDLSKGRDEFCISAVANKGNMLAKNTSKYNDHHWHIISSQCFFFVFVFLLDLSVRIHNIPRWLFISAVKIIYLMFLLCCQFCYNTFFKWYDLLIV